MTFRHRFSAGFAGVALIAASTLAFAAEPAGVYSADQLMNAKVYMSDADEPLGKIDDIIFDNDMQIKSFIVEASGNYGLGGKSYVVPPDQLSVEAMAGEKATKPTYRATLDSSGKQLSDYPKYDDAWWENTQAQATAAWQKTKQSAGNAWTRIKKDTNNLIDRAQGQTDDATQNK